MKKSVYKKVLILGSGALKIGEAGEFDYSGSQGLKALKEAGVKTVLVNPNIATIQTSQLLANQIYFLPVTPEFVERVIEKEKPDGILLSFGGQTALNCGVELHRRGVLKKHKVAVLGTPIQAIILTEDREKFADHLRKIGVPVPPSGAATTLAAAEKIVKRIGFPVMVRAAYALGGQKSGVAHNLRELREIASGALAISPQVLVEKYLRHYKELEYEVVRDAADNCVTVCNMENMDPMGIHTGESIVVAPSQTLTNSEYHELRAASIKIVRSLGIVGECNVQFALDPRSSQYYVIEVNARLSRSSALASKATGYPLAYVAAKLALGKLLHEIPNSVTRVTKSFFEPALDYIVVKIPRWDLEKFRGAEERIGSAMKSVGEVMAIGRTFEEALQKAIRMLGGRSQSIMENGFNGNSKVIKKFLEMPTPKRLFAIAAALQRKFTIEEIYKLTGIDPWFLHRIKNIVDVERRLATLDFQQLSHLKQLGFSDARIAEVLGKTESHIRQLRHKFQIRPAVFSIDTLAGEVPARTNYLYLTYNGSHHDVKHLGSKGVIVLGSGPYHIGSSVEFDWSCVHTALALKKFGKKSIIVNCNPETVSTDYDMSDRLYFEELTHETVSEIAAFEKSSGVVISVGGQTPNNLAADLAADGVRILGTSSADIDRAEDRNKFSALLDELQVPQPQWRSFTSMAEAKSFAASAGYPVLVRPSYVLSGSAMSVCQSEKELEFFVEKAAVINRRYPVTISKFMTSAKELEYDAVAQNGEVHLAAISEHVENAGVHSGDATIVHPAQKVYIATARAIEEIGRKIAHALRISGPFNIQFLVKDNRVYVIEVNLRASRTLPFISKVTGANFADAAAAAFYPHTRRRGRSGVGVYGKSRPINLGYPNYVAVKTPQFSFARLTGSDPVLHVEMSSTGEVAAFGDDFEEALLKSTLAAVSFSWKKSVLLSLGGEVNKKRFLESARALADLGYQIYATDTTADFLASYNIAARKVHKVYERKKPDVLDAIARKQVSLVINLSERESGEFSDHDAEHVSDGFLIRRAAVDANIPLFTDLNLARSFVKALATYKFEDLKIKPYSSYK